MRPWWLKLWHWIRRYRPQLDYVVTEVRNDTTCTIE
jgi:hypothetical protein